MNSDLYAELEWRGILKQVTDPSLKARLKKGPITLYAGFDPTSDSLHVGSLLPLMTLKRFENAGHKVIAVVGGATGMVGDPSGKSQERNLLTSEVLDTNLKGIRKAIERILEKPKVFNNASWTENLSFLEFLRDVGKHFTVNHMMAKESVRARLEDREHGISYTEFSYMLLQAWDFYVLHRDHGCELQIGGSDQWGNITAGIELIRRKTFHEAETTSKEHTVFGLTHPLVMKSDGTKFGKTESGNIWIDPNKTPPYAFYQFFIQTPDADVLTYLKYFTFHTQAEITALEASLKTHPEKREAQKALAQAMTKLVHGEAALKEAESAANALFSKKLSDLDEKSLLSALSSAPVSTLARSKVIGSSLVDLLVETKLSSSKGAARKDLEGGGIYLNDERVTDSQLRCQSEHVGKGGYLILRKGKKNYHLVKVTG